MDADQPPIAGADTAEPPPAPAARAAAVMEVLLCSGYPTQIAVAQTFAVFGVRPISPTSFSLAYVTAISLVDTAILIGLMVFFLRSRGESPRVAFFGERPLRSELRAGLPLVFVAFVIAVVLMLTLQAVAPWLHNVTRNPFQDAVKTRLDVVLLVLVVVIAGGLREELQRAFLLGRFDRWLGGARVGLVLTSLAFGLGHYYEGRDAVIVTATLGAFWGSVYLARRSAAAPIVSHAGFNLLQVVQFLTVIR